MFNKRKGRTRFVLINPKRKIVNVNTDQVKLNVKNKHKTQIKSYKGEKKSIFNKGDNVVFKDYSTPGKVSWIRGSVLKKLGTHIYLIKTKN